MPRNRLGRQLQEWLLRHREEMIDFVSQLVEIESPTSHPETQHPILRLLGDAFQELGMKVAIRPGQSSGGVLQAHFPGAEHGCQLLLGHCDTVWPLGTLQEMPLRREQDRLAGPGIFDMKSGLGHMVFALRALRDLGALHSCPVRVLINSDEEIGSPDSRETIRRAAETANRVYVLEPSAGSDGKLKTARKGIVQFTLRITGKASHAGLAPEEGVSAILELANVIQTLWKFNDPERGLTLNVGVVAGGLRANVVAPEASARVDVRILSRDQLDEIETAIAGLKPNLPGATFQIEDWMSQLPLERRPLHRPLWRLAQEAARDLGFELQETIVGGGSDGNLTSQFAPTLDGLGAVGDGAHARHEFIFLDRMLERTALLGLLLASPQTE